MNLRNYKEDDAKEILNWIKNEKDELYRRK